MIYTKIDPVNTGQYYWKLHVFLGINQNANINGYKEQVTQSIENNINESLDIITLILCVILFKGHE